ncbi:hypothetical protein SeMB42_g01976 [Synchytrium endobioticum]|uniref:Transcription initiation factor IIA subunit 2 n=1 Tax=Synchytrium endobioticum TaxID=286115 RepID=A0A507DK89_9FUNG|nr:hypothetical protein SeMB42_g01976 [Synchytrium endobioticum]
MIADTLILTLLVSSAAGHKLKTFNNTVELDYGTVEGALANNVRSWLGIPFAAPPIGKNRFRAPKAPLSLNGTFHATSFGYWCPQAPLSATSNAPTPPQIMVFVHGGASSSGSGAFTRYNGTNMINNNPDNPVIVVSINYRLGVLGWLAGAEMASEKALNLGLLDQAHAFSWVRKHIGKFGGDSSRITAYGESAGAMSIGQHLISHHGTQTGFDAAIMQSGTTYSGLVDSPRSASNQRLFDAFLSNTTCASITGQRPRHIIKCLQNLTWHEIYTAQEYAVTKAGTGVNTNVGTFHAVVDGKFITASPKDAVINGWVSKVPVIIGTNTNEGTIFTSTSANTEAGLQAYINTISANLPAGSAANLSSVYTSAAYGSPFKAASQLFADIAFVCPSKALSRDLAQAGRKVWKYRFDVLLNVAKPLWNTLGVYHSSELTFLWSTGLQASEMPTGAAIIGRWTKFATYHNPNGATANGSNWPAYSGVEWQQHLIQAATLPTFSNEQDTLGDANYAVEDQVFGRVITNTTSTTTRFLANMEYQLYRASSVGMALTETLDAMVTAGQIDPKAAVKILSQFDRSMSEALRTKVTAKAQFKGHLSVYRFCDDVWTFVIQDSVFRMENETLNVDGKVKVVACSYKAPAVKDE